MPDKTLAMHPHIYNEGQILNFKQLNEGIDPNPTQFCFSGSIGNKSITTLISSTNNLNQITGRALLGIHKLLSYFGLVHDPSEIFFKIPSIFNNFQQTFFQQGGIMKV